MGRPKDLERSRALMGNKNASGKRGALKAASVGASLGSGSVVGLMAKANTLQALTAPKKFIAKGIIKGAVGLGSYQGLTTGGLTAVGNVLSGVAAANSLTRASAAAGIGAKYTLSGRGAMALAKAGFKAGAINPMTGLMAAYGGTIGGLNANLIVKAAPKVIAAGGLVGAGAGLIGYGAYRGIKYLRSKK